MNYTTQSKNSLNKRESLDCFKSRLMREVKNLRWTSQKGLIMPPGISNCSYKLNLHTEKHTFLLGTSHQITSSKLSHFLTDLSFIKQLVSKDKTKIKCVNETHLVNWNKEPTHLKFNHLN